MAKTSGWKAPSLLLPLSDFPIPNHQSPLFYSLTANLSLPHANAIIARVVKKPAIRMAVLGVTLLGSAAAFYFIAPVFVRDQMFASYPKIGRASCRGRGS